MLTETVWVYQRDNKPENAFYAYIRMPEGDRIRRSLKTTQLAKAMILAEQLYMSLRAERLSGISTSRTSWKEAAEDFRTYKVNNDGRISANTANALGMLDLFFADYKDLNQITTQTIRSWFNWRRDFWQTEAGKLEYKKRGLVGGYAHKNNVGGYTIKRDLFVLKAVLVFAKDRGKVLQIPDFKAVLSDKAVQEGAKRRRAEISSSQFRTILNKLRKREHTLLTRRSLQVERSVNTHNTDLRLWQHRALEFFVHLIDKTGLRVQEAKRLRFEDVSLHTEGAESTIEFVKIEVRKEVSKVKKHRVCFSLEYDQTKSRKSTLWSKYILLQEAIQAVDAFLPSDFIFRDLRNPGNHIYKVDTAFNDYIKRHLDLDKDRHGNRYSATSLRHRFITKAIKQGNSVGFVAELCGTSEKMIRQHYSHILAFELRNSFVQNQMRYYSTLSR